MLIKVLFAYLFGYVHICIEGYFIERFMNLCISKKILLWNTKRKKSTILNANISIRDYKEIKELLKTTKCKCKIEQKKGLPFVLHRYKKRKVFFAFLILIFIGVFISSLFVWNIEIAGTTGIAKEELLKELELSGLTIRKIKKRN